MHTTRRSTLLLLIALLLAAPLVAGACSDSDDGGDAAEDSGSDSGSGTDGDSDDTGADSTSTTGSNVNQGATIAITDFQFGDGAAVPVTMEAGKAVTWTNDSPAIGHQVLHEEPDTTRSFESPIIGPGESFTETIDQPGTYNYVCAIHPDRMQGVLIVEPAA